MRISRQQAEENRARMLAAAGRLFRQRGFDGVSVADLTAACGFTHGGFYNHFASKAVLAAEATKAAFRDREDNPVYGGSLRRAIRAYLGKAHRDMVAAGCPAVALSGDAARATAPVRVAFADGIESMVQWFDDALARETPLAEAERRAAALNFVARLVGAVSLARAAPDDHALSSGVLEACLAGCLAEVERLSAPKTENGAGEPSALR